MNNLRKDEKTEREGFDHSGALATGSLYAFMAAGIPHVINDFKEFLEDAVDRLENEEKQEKKWWM